MCLTTISVHITKHYLTRVAIMAWNENFLPQKLHSNKKNYCYISQGNLAATFMYENCWGILTDYSRWGILAAIGYCVNDSTQQISFRENLHPYNFPGNNVFMQNKPG